MKHFLILLVSLFFLSLLSAQTDELIPYRKGALWGFADTAGIIKIEPKLEEVGRFWKNKMARFKKGNKYGYLNIYGQVVLKAKYDEASQWLGSFGIVKKGNKEFCINSIGEKVKCIYGCGGAYNTMIYFNQFEIAGKIGIRPRKAFMTSAAKTTLLPKVTDPIWDELRENHHGLAAVKKEGKWGVIDTEGNLLIDYVYDDIIHKNDFLDHRSEYYFIIQNGELFGFINTEGKVICSPKYLKVEPFEEGLAKVWISSNFWGYIDEAGRAYFEM